MEPSVAVPNRVRFGLFEADLARRELRKRGRRVPLQDQPFQVLALLLGHPGELVTREELQQALWPADTFVEFEHGVNTAIKKIRQALGDSADNPRFIETLPRRGYRFIAPVEKAEDRGCQRRHTRRRILLVGSCLALALVLAAAAIGVWVVRSKTGAPEADLVAVPLTSYPGTENSPSFSPDGTQVAFQWCPADPGKSCDIYVKQIGVEPPSRLTDTPALEYSPVWSPDGRTIAFLRPLDATRRALVLIPQRGGRERVLAELDFSRRKEVIGGPYLAWTPDSKWLVSPWVEATSPRYSLFMFSVETGERRRLTNPPAVGVGLIVGDTAPVFSPDGRTLAFTRYGGRTDLYLLRLAEGYVPQGEPERVASDNMYNSGAAWTQDGNEIVFTSGTLYNRRLWRVAASKSMKPRRLAFVGDQASMPAVSRQGNRLAYAVSRDDSNIWRVDLGGAGQKAGIPVKFISSTKWEGSPAYSPDGKRIAFVSRQSGAPEVWVCESDGSNPVQLTSFGGAIIYGPKWSPGGESIAFQAEPGGNADIYVISANGGAPRRLTTDPRDDKWPSWSRDGQWLYITIVPGGQIWKMPSSGGEAIQITRNEGDVAKESPDGKWLYYQRGWPRPLSVWRMPVEGGEETKVLDSVHPYGQWTVGKRGLYFVLTPDQQGHSSLCLHEFATGKTRKLATTERSPGLGMAVSPDGRTLLYAQYDEAGSDLMLVENFR